MCVCVCFRLNEICVAVQRCSVRLSVLHKWNEMCMHLNLFKNFGTNAMENGKYVLAAPTQIRVSSWRAHTRECECVAVCLQRSQHWILLLLFVHIARRYGIVMAIAKVGQNIIRGRFSAGFLAWRRRRHTARQKSSRLHAFLQSFEFKMSRLCDDLHFCIRRCHSVCDSFKKSHWKSEE